MSANLIGSLGGTIAALAMGGLSYRAEMFDEFINFLAELNTYVRPRAIQ